MKPVIKEQTPEISGGIVDCEPVPIIDEPLPAPYPGGGIYPPAPITPVIDEPFTVIKL